MKKCVSLTLFGAARIAEYPRRLVAIWLLTTKPLCRRACPHPPPQTSPRIAHTQTEPEWQESEVVVLVVRKETCKIVSKGVGPCKQQHAKGQESVPNWSSSCSPWRQPRVTLMTAAPTYVTNCRVTNRLGASALSNCEEPPCWSSAASPLPCADIVCDFPRGPSYFSRELPKFYLWI